LLAMYYSKIRVLILFVLIVVSGTRAQRMPSDDTQKGIKLKSGLVTVASIGPINISVDEFQFNYDFGPAFLKRQKNSKKRYLDLMINEKILALEGYAQHLDKTKQVRNSLGLIKADLISEELFRDEVMAKVSISKSEIRKAVEQSLQHIHLKWLFRKTLVKIQRDFYALKQRAPFERLFNNQLGDSIKIDDRSMESTLFELAHKNPALKSIIDTLKIGTFTRPIKSIDGYYIVKITNGWKDKLLTETAWNTSSEKMHNLLFKQQMDSLSDRYVDSLLRASNPIIKRAGFNLLRAWLAKKDLSMEQFHAWGFLKNVNLENGQNLTEAINSHGLTELVRLYNGAVSLSDFLFWYHPRRTYIKLNKTSRDAFANSVQSLIWRMLRDKLLTEQALRRGLQKMKNVIRQSRWWEDKIIFSKYKLDLANTIAVTDDEALKYYNHNKISYRSKSGVYQPFDKVKTEIKNSLRREKYGTKLIHAVLAAKQKYKIKINRKVLNDIVVDTENDPRAIEVYTVKKGGLIPRQPYPTIDSEWKYWY